MILYLFACTAEPEPAPAGCPCDQIVLPDAPITTEAGLLTLLHDVVDGAWPELGSLTLAMSAVDDLAYLSTSIDLSTLDDEDPDARVYRVNYDPLLLEDPPSPLAMAAILLHELGHAADYVPMTTAEYVTFGIWYGTQDPLTSEALAAYERETDEAALTRGCAEGLSEMRTWIYAHASDEVLAEKLHNYYSPAEIDTWVDTHGACPG